MPFKDPEKAKEAKKRSYEKCKKNSEWVENRNDYRKKYYQENKQKELRQQSTYYKNLDDFHKKKKGWVSTHKMKLRPGEDWESIYIYYTICDHCEQCGVTFGTAANRNNSKNLDHDHSTGFVRAVVCWDCNIHRIR